jgi:hypothetical protein
MKQNNPLSIRKMSLYLIIIFGIGYFLTKHTIDFGLITHMKYTVRILMGIGFAILMLGLRDFGYVMRLRLLTDNQISLKQSIQTILLWEFGSAITPGMLGGKAVAIYLLIKNGINAAKASSIVLLAIIFDEILFILAFPLFFFIVGDQMLTPSMGCAEVAALQQKLSFLSNIQYVKQASWMMLGFLFLFVFLVFVGVFVVPSHIRNLLYAVSKIPLVNRKQQSIVVFADDIYESSLVYRRKPSIFWVNLVLYTMLSWIGRYLVGVAIVWAFASPSLFDFLIVYAKQYTLWLQFYLPTTPGSSGLAEMLFITFYCQYIPEGFTAVAAFFWRFVSYYVYLFIGIIVLMGPPIYHYVKKRKLN